MRTDKIEVNSNGGGRERALEEVSKFGSYEGVDKKTLLRLQLLVEETLGMFSAITGDFKAGFWMEGSKGESCLLHLEAETDMDYAKKQGLIDVSTKKKNAASKGFMGKIKDIIENSLYGIGEADRLYAEYGGVPLMYGEMGYDSTYSMSYLWSLARYKKEIDQAKEAEKDETREEALDEAWDELEKSIVASIADDVQVAVSGDKVELVIKKKL